ncbi:MAG TPA: UDP-N-acetylmuramoyl-tripeptide--D-alanyl-D-alanine ligase [Streptosporangiaceae bacterium]|nr:UDP-N-acetylmuramoyl-tripeptide--D-alanyl-D-alanine ligase [Streptosporangiaceae bacterium]
MIGLSIERIASVTGGALDQVDNPARMVTGPVVIDSRQATWGALFAALPGERVDGHDFAGQAVAAGAALVIGTRPVGVPALIVADVPAALAKLARAVVDQLPDLTIAGITGSAGKTTTKDLVAQLTSTLGPTVSPQNSFNNEIGHPLTVLRADEDTRYLIAEMSARGLGHIAALCQISPPALGVVLCVGNAHAGEYTGIEQIAEAKSELPAALPADGVALLNADDPLVARMAEVTPARVITFGWSGGADVRATGVELDRLSRPRFTLTSRAGSADVALRLSGAHNVTNALAAAALAGELGMSVDAIAAGLSQAVAKSHWRMEVTEGADGVIVVNDAYNSSPEAMAAALAAIRVMASGRRAYAVLGRMAELGERSREFHEQAGVIAAKTGLTGIIAVGDEATMILGGAKSVPDFTGELVAVPDDQAALAAITHRLRPGDVVLVKASRAAGLQTVALALTAMLTREDGRPGPPAKEASS